MKRLVFLLLIALITGRHGICGVEQASLEVNGKSYFLWWPIVGTPSGFSVDQDASIAQNKKIFVQNGASISNSQIVLFAEAVLKSDLPQIYTLNHFASERFKFRKKSDPDIFGTALKWFKDGDGIPLDVTLLISTSRPEITFVIYQDECKFYVSLEVVSKSKEVSKIGTKAFLEMLKGYHVN
jgi:hypothetical protein